MATKRRGRWTARWVAGCVGALAALMPVAGCGGPEDRINLPAPMAGAQHSVEYLRAVLETNGRRWVTLEADCTVVIANPQIPRQGNQVRLSGGRLYYMKPGKVHLRAPATGRTGLRAVGDGQAYQVEMSLFEDRYAGLYDDPLIVRPRRVHLLPADIVYALEPTELMVDRGLVLRQWEDLSILDCLDFVTEPAPALTIEGSILVRRDNDRITHMETYDDAGAVRSRIRYLVSDTVLTRKDEPVLLPQVIGLTYPQERTAVLLRLSNIKLNTEVKPEMFELTRSSPPRSPGQPVPNR
jgi:hypothetical protein